jgi:hypothetical protein
MGQTGMVSKGSILNMPAPKGSTISATIPLGNTGVQLNIFYITEIDIVYSQGVFVSGTISIAGYVAASDTDPVTYDSIKPQIGPAANQDVMQWAVNAVLQDAKYAGGTAS